MRGTLRVAALLCACAAWPALAGAQPRVIVRDAGPGRMGRLVQEALVRPYVLMTGDTTDLVLERGIRTDSSLVVFGRDVRIASRVRGDLVVIGGDVFLRPYAQIDGDVIAVGGAVYNSTLARVGGDRHSFRDATLVPTLLPDGTWALDYRELRTRTYTTFALPSIYGLRIPEYDRVNGLSLTWGPFLHLGAGSISVDPTITYRTHLGKVDPAAVATYSMSRRTRFEIFAGRTSMTNEEWIASDASNSLKTIWQGRDTRNWYRADRAEGALHRLYETPTSEITPYVGAVWERAWTTGIQAPPRHLAFSVLDRRDPVEGMARPNPVIDEGVIASAVAGFDGSWESPPHELEVRGTGRLEAAPSVVGNRRFTQLTLDGRVTFPLRRNLEFRLDVHGVTTRGDAPAQRYAYLGGSGTVKTLDLLSQGGDQLIFTESRATMQLDRFRLPVVGPPKVMVRHLMGAAGVGGLPGLTHNVGVRVQAAVLRAEFIIDPVAGKPEFGLAISF